VHGVRWEGEALSLIAEWYTGSWRNWEAIARVNPGLDPNRIRIGDRILIPEGLLKKREPMPPDFLPSSPVSRTAAPPSPARGPPEKPEEGEIPDAPGSDDSPTAAAERIELFGPAEATGDRAPVPDEMDLFGPMEIAGRGARIPEETELFGPVE